MKKVFKKASLSIFTIALTVGTLGLNEAIGQTQLEREFDDGSANCGKDAVLYNGFCEYYHGKICCLND